MSIFRKEKSNTEKAASLAKNLAENLSKKGKTIKDSLNITWHIISDPRVSDFFLPM